MAIISVVEIIGIVSALAVRMGWVAGALAWTSMGVAVILVALFRNHILPDGSTVEETRFVRREQVT